MAVTLVCEDRLNSLNLFPPLTDSTLVGKFNLSKFLMDEAIEYACQNPLLMTPQYNAIDFELNTPEAKARGGGLHWYGLIQIHAQIGLENFYMKHGFKTDITMGTWMEEGIEHIGMWRRVKPTGSYHKRITAAMMTGMT